MPVLFGERPETMRLRCIMLEPRELTVPDSISAKTLQDMDKAIANFKLGDVSEAVELSDF